MANRFAALRRARRPRTAALLAVTTLAVAAAPRPVVAQTFATDDTVLRAIYDIGMRHSEVYPLAQALMDSIGPRLTGTPGIARGQAWLLGRYAAWGIPAQNVPYGTWKSWRRGVSHLDLLTPRARSLEATMLAWSPGTGNRPVAGPVVLLPQAADSAAFAALLPRVRGSFVLVSFPEPTCRPDSTWAHFATPASYARMRAARDSARRAWQGRIAATGYAMNYRTGTLAQALERAGALGILTSTWSGGYGVDRIFYAHTTRVPTFDVSCEDYGLLARMAAADQHPSVRMVADAQFLGDVPVSNTIAQLRGTTKPDEYVMLSAHFDSWDGSSGATDNGTGTVTMLEAMRILKQVDPHPTRTIIVGHWSAEEEGLIGSGAFAADHPGIVRGMQALFNQDNGTGRIVNFSAQGLVNAWSHLGLYFSRLPEEFTSGIQYAFPGQPGGGGSDFASFLCHGAPAFELGSLNWEYFAYTWHTNRDTFDKLSFDELKRNATMTAMLAYLAAEDPTPMPREQRIDIHTYRSTRPAVWPTCGPTPRSWAAWQAGLAH